MTYGYRDQTNPARQRSHLDKLLPRPTKVKKPVHLPAMSYAGLPPFMAELRTDGSLSALVLQFLILTAVRTSEALQARWEEIDQEARTWTVPVSRMKAGRVSTAFRRRIMNVCGNQQYHCETYGADGVPEPRECYRKPNKYIPVAREYFGKRDVSIVPESKAR